MRLSQHPRRKRRDPTWSTTCTLPVPAAGRGLRRNAARGRQRHREGKRANRRIDAVVACATDIEGLAVKPARVTMALLIEFDRDMADIKPQYHDDLRTVADFLKAHPTVTATIEGHTANTQATPALAQEISRAPRAEYLELPRQQLRHRALAPDGGRVRRHRGDSPTTRLSRASRKTGGSTSSSITGNNASSSCAPAELLTAAGPGAPGGRQSGHSNMSTSRAGGGGRPPRNSVPYGSR